MNQTASVEKSKWMSCLQDVALSLENYPNKPETDVTNVYGQIVTSDQLNSSKKCESKPEPIYSKLETYSRVSDKYQLPSNPTKTFAVTSDREHSHHGTRPLASLTKNILRTYRRIDEVSFKQVPKLRPIPKQAQNFYDTGTAAETCKLFLACLSLHLAQPTTLVQSSSTGSYVISVAHAQKQQNQKVASAKSQIQLDAELLKCFRVDSILQNRYKLIKTIGSGTFGQVFQAIDLHSGADVAVKVIRKRLCFMRQAFEEIKNLTFIMQFQDSGLIPGAEHFVRFHGYFMEHQHLCLVMDLLAGNLFQLLKNTQYRGVSLTLTRKFGAQLCEALFFLSHPQVNIIHCDLKPENIIMVNLKRSAIKVIDFGSSCRLDERPFQYIQSRFYRSPEVIFGLEYGFAIDTWSLGCILVELHIGDPLFPGENELDQLLKIIEVLGMPPASMIEASPKRDLFFESVSLADLIKLAPGEQLAQLSEEELLTRLPKDCVIESRRSSSGLPLSVLRPRRVWNGTDGASFECKFAGAQSRPLTRILGVYTKGPVGQHATKAGHELADYERFLDLIQRMLRYTPEERILPNAALQHPFFSFYTGQPPDPSNLVLAKKPDADNLASLPPGYVMAIGESKCNSDKSSRREGYLKPDDI
ncbi:Dual specificity tyrosine-phosphorylation-regulated kinase 1A [Cichlidogyrus casuarinus]|uniref:Dual specificity tyrosine-phosphorylation-regulated kinase 1A n=1 Tax=Cichlidogyrus casuarinus TaxID=1844966 RepID=A0ABD2Q938_9PLAT